VQSYELTKHVLTVSRCHVKFKLPEHIFVRLLFGGPNFRYTCTDEADDRTRIAGSMDPWQHEAEKTMETGTNLDRPGFPPV
jgi:hypothetical protein